MPQGMDFSPSPLYCGTRKAELLYVNACGSIFWPHGLTVALMGCRCLWRLVGPGCPRMCTSEPTSRSPVLPTWVLPLSTSWALSRPATWCHPCWRRHFRRYKDCMPMKSAEGSGVILIIIKMCPTIRPEGRSLSPHATGCTHSDSRRAARCWWGGALRKCSRRKGGRCRRTYIRNSRSEIRPSLPSASMSAIISDRSELLMPPPTSVSTYRTEMQAR